MYEFGFGVCKGSSNLASKGSFQGSKLGSPVVPFYPFSFWVPLLKPNSRKKGTLIIKGLLGNLGKGKGFRVV